METKKIGQIDFSPSIMGLGCWAFGGAHWGGQDDKDSLEAIAAALDAGITHYDTARAYGGGASERVIGPPLKPHREKVFIASKQVGVKPDKMIAAVEESLKCLQMDYIDLYYIHWPGGGDVRPSMEGLMKAKEQGKIRGIGVSNFSVEHMTQALEIGPIDAHQLGYNLLWRVAEKKIIPFCIEKDITIVSYSSIAMGILTGKFSKTPEFKEGDVRPSTVYFQDEVWPYMYDAVEEMKKVAEAAGCPLAHIAIQWVKAQKGISSILVGARNGSQLEKNVAALDEPVSEDILQQLTAISDEAIQHLPDESNMFGI